ncbi:hypothetical protein [Pseudomonas sp. NPDC089569]|uniref:hypothetical protein n=1 Tax=Pseudomonas sp. NPDC089569 TaxID=3390722 RepID=UPI003D028FB5
MNISYRNSPTPQLGFDFLLAGSGEAHVNKPGVHVQLDADCQVPAGSSVGDALARMVVQDRALGLGITNWRVLIDSAISTGHVELYAGEGNSQGLRKPGLRFGPIASMPEIGPEYVKRCMLAKQLTKAAKMTEPVKSGRTTIDGAIKVECILGAETIHFNFYDVRKNAGAISMCPADLPFSSADTVKDTDIQRLYLAMRLERELPDLGAPSVLAAGVLQSLGLALKSLEK